VNYTIRPAPRLHYEWLKERTGGELSDGYRAIEALDSLVDFCPRCGLRHGRVRGMVGYSSWTPNSVRMDIALDAPATFRALLPHMFKYPFTEGGREMAFVVIASDNKRSLKLTEHTGFKELHRLVDAHSPGVDLVVMMLRRSDCRKERL